MTEELIPPRLRDDCFAMPQGVEWTPVDTAMAELRDMLVPTGRTEVIRTFSAAGRILAEPATARRANPPAANSAVDGYGLAHASSTTGVNRLRLAKGRAAAGRPFDGTLAPGEAVRILTGAILPQGVDTVILEEDCAVGQQEIAFDGPLRRGMNCRKAGEDLPSGAEALPKGHRLRAPDLALLTALGIDQIRVFRPLRVGVLSTGDEVLDAGCAARDHQIYDANRPMILALVRGWGYEGVDLGIARDDPAAIAQSLGAGDLDMVITSGGASAGDEDHMAALLRARGTLQTWRIAMKPGRPLALGEWEGRPVIALPGNPVAAMVCAVLFARPALSFCAGAGWAVPLRLRLPASFSKSKKAGRREYLRARHTEGRVEVFTSEGSGRISGLSWANGLVELPVEATEITPGEPVTFIPYEGFGIA